jgi:surface protein
MFSGASFYSGIGINHWDVSNVQTMNNMFSLASTFDANLSQWNVAKVISFGGMFFCASSFRGIGLEHWNVNQAKDMASMFLMTPKFDANLSQWNVAKVTDMSSMFQQAYHFQGNGLSLWNVSNVAFMNNMFVDATRFDANLSGWDISNVKDMSDMFQNASSFQGVSWYQSLFLRRFDLNKNELVHCDPGDETIIYCTASTYCLADGINVTNWIKYVDAQDPYSNIYLINVTVDDDTIHLSGNILFAFRFPRDCSVSCTDHCQCVDGCTSTMIGNISL